MLSREHYVVIANRVLQEVFRTCLLLLCLQFQENLSAAQIAFVSVGQEVSFGAEAPAEVSGHLEDGCIACRHLAVDGYSDAGFEMSVE